MLQFMLGVPLAHLQARDPIPTAVLGLNAASHLLLLLGVFGLARSGAAGTTRWARGGLVLAAAGLAVLTLAEFVAMVSPPTAVPMYFAASLAIAAGMIVAGIGVARANRWAGWRRFTPLASGLFVPLVLFPAFGLPGYAPHYAIALWGGCWLLLGLSLLGECNSHS